MTSLKEPIELAQSNEFHRFVLGIKERIRSSQLNAIRAVNKELIQLYWSIGESIAKKQLEQKWGSAIVEELARELQLEFPGIQGFSTRNIWRMRNLYLAYTGNIKLPQLVAEIGWSHNTIILEKCKDNLEREYYIKMTKQFGWSRTVLEQNIESKSYEAFLTNQTSFDRELPDAYKHQAKLAVKDEYSFDFLGLGEEYSEAELENGLLSNIKRFLTEMGGYFCFIGNQYRLEVDGDEFFIDLLFYHRKLKCMIAIELKTGKFKPEYAGKMQFYLSALDNIEKLDDENKSIGLIICKDKNRTVVEYTLQDTKKPMGIATYKTKRDLPKNITDLLPTPEEIAKRLEKFLD